MKTKKIILSLFIAVIVLGATMVLGVAANANAMPAYAENGNAAINSWIQTPNVMRWRYGEYDPAVNLIIAEAEFKDEPVLFSIAIDREGLVHANGKLVNFTADNGIVSEEVAKELAKLNVGEYYLCASVAASNGHAELRPAPMKFVISQGNNQWITTPELLSWTEGKFDEKTNAVKAVAKFGNDNMRVVICRAGDKTAVIYDSVSGIDNRAKAKAGSYEITVSVNGTDNYRALTKTFTFNVFKKAGMPWWSALMTAFAALGLASLALALLHQKGAIQILSGKIYIAMRNRATVDATIAAVRANKVAKEAEKSAAQTKDKTDAEQDNNTTNK